MEQVKVTKHTTQFQPISFTVVLESAEEVEVMREILRGVGSSRDSQPSEFNSTRSNLRLLLQEMLK